MGLDGLDLEDISHHSLGMVELHRKIAPGNASDCPAVLPIDRNIGAATMKNLWEVKVEGVLVPNFWFGSTSLEPIGLDADSQAWEHAKELKTSAKDAAKISEEVKARRSCRGSLVNMDDIPEGQLPIKLSCVIVWL